MAGLGGGSREELLQTAYNLGDMLKQLKAAAEEGRFGRGSEGRGGGRGRSERSGGRGRGGNERRGGGHRGRGRGGRGDYRGSPNRGGYDSSWRTRDEMEEAQCGTYNRQSNDWRARDSSCTYQDLRREDWRVERDVLDYPRGRYQSNYQESSRANWQAQRGVQDYPGERYHIQGSQRGQVGETRERWVEPHKLVKALSTQPSFSASLLQLMEQHQLTPASVRATALRYSHVFCLQGETVQLQPQLDICAEHCGLHGCQHRHTCMNLHVCPKMAVATCDAGQTCVLGHSWHTDHNVAVLKSLFLDHLRDQALRELLQLLYAGQEGQHQDLGLLTVCADYNQSQCERTACDQLHVCLSFVTRLTQCSHKDCQLNHDLQSPSCHHLLQLHGFSTNESPRDILVALLQANPSLSQAPKETKDNPQSPIKNNKASKEKDREKTPEDNKPESKKRVEDIQSKSKKHTEDNQSISKKHVEDNQLKPRKQKTADDTDRDMSSGENSQDSDEAADKLRKVASRKAKSKGKFVVSGSEDNSSSSAESESESSDENYRSLEKLQKKNIKNQKVWGGSKDLEKKKATKKNQLLGDGEETEKNIEAVKVTGVPKDGIRRRTLWAHYLLGDVATPEICYYSVESVCKNEGSVCPRLHASHHFHWQIRKQSDCWKNLRHNQVICLERAFCDPEQKGVDIPRLDPSSLDMSLTGLLILLGRDTWHADFPDTATFTGFTLTNSAKTVTLELRRLCTELLPSQPILPAKNMWYFLDKNSKWVKYGNVDTAGETNLVSSITSDDIEKYFQQSPMAPLSFKNSQFTYILDLQTMKQTNQNTKVSRVVRRRPEPHLPSEQEEKKDDGQKKSSELPSHWEEMQPEERLRLVTLAPTSTEYQTAVGLLAGRVSTSSVMKVERIQNVFLWRAFQNKVKELSAVYGDDSKVDVRQLFHGTSHNVISSICAENLDWRLHGTASGQLYGRGTYFSTDAAYSYNYCQGDSSGLKYMFVAKVAVGTITQGNSSMVRPPTNPATSLPFDSTGNSAPNPSIIVKYDKQEYYPEYILTLT